MEYFRCLQENANYCVGLAFKTVIHESSPVRKERGRHLVELIKL